MNTQPFKTRRNSLLARIAFLISLFALLLGSCASAAPTKQTYSSAPASGGAQPVQAPAPAVAPQAGSTNMRSSIPNESSNAAGGNTTAQTIERIVIKNANISIVVSDPAKSMDTISKMADEMGGFVVSANLDQVTLDSGAKAPHASITIRVKAERLNEALDRIRAESDRPVLAEKVDSQDVTSDYTDLQSRLRNLQNTEADLTKIMDQATKTEDVMSVYNQLTQVREQIEVIQGKIKYYEQSAALSAISVDLQANAAVQPLTIGSWQPVGVAKDATQALIDTLKFLANAAIWVLIFVLPILLVIYLVFVLPVSLILRAWRQRRNRNKAAPSTPPAPPAA
ncbi:MAG TPA: DUF4349 domain-containing protein [Anaerolineales bacterium]